MFVFEEEAEKNPRARPTQPGLGEIAIGCCDGARYLVLEVDERHATLRLSRPGTRADGAIEELRFQRGCD